MTCAGVRRRLSEWLDGDLEASVSRTVSAHLESCGACTRHAEELRAVSGLLAALPRVEAEPVEARVALRLELAAGARRPALAYLFRGMAAARPLILPSLVSATCLLLLVFGGLMALDPGPLPEVRLAPGAWSSVPASGTEANPLIPSADRKSTRLNSSHYALSRMPSSA